MCKDSLTVIIGFVLYYTIVVASKYSSAEIAGIDKILVIFAEFL